MKPWTKKAITFLNVLSFTAISSLNLSIAEAQNKTARPPQYVIISFDGSKNLDMWSETRDLAKDLKARFTYFISGVYFIPDSRSQELYNPPKKRAGASDIGFAKSVEDIEGRIDQMNLTMDDAGAEIGSHVNGHFDGSKWDLREWRSEMDQFHDFVLNVFDINDINGNKAAWQSRLAPMMKGFRAPLLGYNEHSDQVLRDKGYTYDTSRSAPMTEWPSRKRSGLWIFPLGIIPVVGTARKTISMDYNFYFVDSKGAADKANARAYEERYYQSLRNYFFTSYNGNRAPVNVGNHFDKWNDGAYWNALNRFAKEVCGLPEVKCTNYVSVIKDLESAKEYRTGAWQMGQFEKLPAEGRFNAQGLKFYDLDIQLEKAGNQIRPIVTGKHKAMFSKNGKIEVTLGGKKISDSLNFKLPADFSGAEELKVSAFLKGSEIQSATRDVVVSQGKLMDISKENKENRSLKGDMPEAHMGQID